jgi:hypothetical protein
MTDALRLPVAERACRATVLAADLAVLDTSNSQIHQAEQQLAVVLPNTPAGVLTTPGASVVGPPTTAQPWRPRPLRQRPLGHNGRCAGTQRRRPQGIVL